MGIAAVEAYNTRPIAASYTWCDGSSRTASDGAAGKCSRRASNASQRTASSSCRHGIWPWTSMPEHSVCAWGTKYAKRATWCYARRHGPKYARSHAAQNDAWRCHARHASARDAHAGFSSSRCIAGAAWLRQHGSATAYAIHSAWHDGKIRRWTSSGDAHNAGATLSFLLLIMW